MLGHHEGWFAVARSMPAMQFPTLREFSLRQLVSRLSVRNRIAAIAVIPVVGFLANGIAFTGGETEVGNAFESVKSAAVLADASREFKAALARMQMASKDFVAQPSDAEVAAFERRPRCSRSDSLDAIAASIGAMQRDEIDMARQSFRAR